MFKFLYCLIIVPIYFVLEFLFNNVYQASNNILTTIILISFAVSVFCLPLYLRADELQKEEEDVQKKLSKKIKIINKNYTGDERLLLLQTLYRQNNYHPIMGLRLSFSLLLQIPFFIAAYTFFSHLTILDGMQLGCIKDLMKPDGILTVNNFAINILPILMTIVNIIAGLVYTKDKSLKGNKALLIISLVFLVLLYNAPSALVIYWLFNNVFSLIKNICLIKFSHNKLLEYAFVVSLFIYSAFLCIYKMSSISLFVILFIVIIFGTKTVKNLKFDFDYKNIFIYSLISLWALMGLLIPSCVIKTSPTEFIFYNVTPIWILLYTATVMLGVFLFWGNCIYYFANTRFKKIISLTSCILFFTALVNLLAIKMPTAIISNIMIFKTGLVDFSFQNANEIIKYAIVLLFVLSAIIYLLCKKKTVLLKNILTAITVSCILISIHNYIVIYYKANLYIEQVIQTEKEATDKYIKLSKNGKNVLVIFLDRAINSYLPIIFRENPSLHKQFKGFTYYPNTLSYAGYTVLGYMPILGGYEYTPFNSDDRDELFEIKYKEATTMLPLIFSQNNYKSSIINPLENSWGKRAWESAWSKLSSKEIKSFINNELYDKYNIKHLNIPDSVINGLETDVKQIDNRLTKRNLIYFSLLSVSVPGIRKYLYNNGAYHNPLEKTQKLYTEDLLKEYAELKFLPELTDFSQKENTFTVFNNSLPHEPFILSYPNYDLSKDSDTNYTPPIQINDNNYSLSHYHVNAASFRLLGDYFDFLRQNNAYDNTRIIIVADHGFGYNLQNPYLGQFEANYYLPYNPLLMFKDFKENGKIITDYSLMTNADVPILAVKNLIKNPKNPYTDKLLTDADKNNGVIIKHDVDWNPSYYYGKRKILKKDDIFLYLNGDPLDHNNWKVNIDYNEAISLKRTKQNDNVHMRPGRNVSDFERKAKKLYVF